jgi:hypothetical protein
MLGIQRAALRHALLGDSRDIVIGKRPGELRLTAIEIDHALKADRFVQHGRNHGGTDTLMPCTLTQRCEAGFEYRAGFLCEHRWRKPQQSRRDNNTQHGDSTAASIAKALARKKAPG